MARGFFAIGVHQPKVPANIGTLMRAAYLYGASYVFTIGKRYTKEATDTPNTPRHIPLLNFADDTDFLAHLPHDTSLVSIEMDDKSVPIQDFQHPERAVYLLGAEDFGIPISLRLRSQSIVEIPTVRPQSMNVSAAGSIVLYTRSIQRG